MKTGTTRAPHLWEALIPVIALIGFLLVTIQAYGQDPHIPLVLGTAIAAIFGMRLGYTWSALLEGMIRGITLALPAILILLVIGILIGLWIAAGIVPLLIDYGLKLLSPQIFLAASCLICSIISLSTGSSWTTAGTVGIALIGVGDALGIPTPMTAGAIISGAYFGDKMSPLSDTTNLAPGVAGSELFEHIRHMAFTTTPSILLALVLFLILGFGHAGETRDTDALVNLMETLESQFILGPWLLIPPVIVIAMVILKIPALPALFVGSLIGGLFAFLFQGVGLYELLEVSMRGYTSDSGNEAVDQLVSRGGMESMFWTVGLILCALTFGGIMERTGMLEVLSAAILKLAQSTGSLVLTTVTTCFGMNALAADQYLAIIVPGRMYRDAYDKAGLHPKNLSRVLEDAGTITSPLIFWNTCGATMSEVLGISAGAYWMFCFFNLINPLISILYGFTGWTMARAASETDLKEG